MDRKHAICIFLGMAIGLVVGGGLGAASGNTILGIGLGFTFGGFIGWFVTVALERRNRS
jgi:hypothetical protein